MVEAEKGDLLSVAKDFYGVPALVDLLHTHVSGRCIYMLTTMDSISVDFELCETTIAPRC